MRYAILATWLILVGLAPAAVGQDDAARIFDEARTALNREQYRDAAARFQEVWESHGDSEYAGEALYWYAFALYRQGGMADLRNAGRALERALKNYEKAATHDDAADLATRIQGELARRGDAESAARLAELAEQLESLSGPGDSSASDDDDLRVAALNALIHMDPERALPLLKSVLERRDPESAELREKAVFLIAQKKSEDTTSLLLDVVRNDPSPEVKEAAVFWLSQVEGDEAVAVLEEILTTAADPEVQEKAVFALAQHDHPRAAEILRSLARDGGAPLDIREEAIFWLGQRKAPESFGFLTDLYGSLEEESLKEKVLFSVAQQPEAKTSDWLLDIAMDASEPVELRKTALFWAAQGRKLPVEKMASLYDELDDPEVKEQVLFVLSQQRSPEAIDRLIHIARTETDTELRKQTVFWLGQIKDPRVLDFLEELINE